jgi:hypothetical protein
MLQISIFWVVIIIFAIHTILTHLLNWGFRMANEYNDDFTLPLVIIQLFEIVFLTVWLQSILQ